MSLKATNKGEAIRYLKANVENGSDGYEEAAAKLGCAPELDELSRVIHSLFVKPAYGDTIINRLKKNERNKAKNMSKKRTRLRNTADYQVKLDDPKTVLEKRIEEIIQNCNAEKLGITMCEKRLQEILQETDSKRKQAEILRDSLRKLLKEVQNLEREAKNLADEQQQHENALLDFDKQLLDLREELQAYNTVHVCIECDLQINNSVSLDTQKVEKVKIKKKVAEFITAPETYPTEFGELVEIATVETLQTVAKAMIVAEQLTAESGNKLIFHSYQNDVATLLKNAGYEVEIVQKKED